MSQNEIMKPEIGLSVAGGRQKGKEAEGREASFIIDFKVDKY